MSSIRIAIQTPPEGTPSFYADSDGLYSLDLRPDTLVAITRRIDDSSKIGSIRFDTVREFDVPTTKKNVALLRDFLNPNAFNKIHTERIPIILQYSNYRVSRTMQVTGIDADGYNLVVFGEMSQWAKAITDLKLNEVELGDFTFTYANIEDRWINGDKYQDGGAVVFPPLVQYGQWRLGNRVAITDYRLWVSPLGLLQRAFCQIGWKFRCPVLESDDGRAAWTYILKKDFRDTSVDPQTLSFRAGYIADLLLPSDPNGGSFAFVAGWVDFPDTITLPNVDPSSLWNVTTGLFNDVPPANQKKLTATWKVYFEVEVTNFTSLFGGSGIFGYLGKRLLNGDIIAISDSQTVAVNSNGTYVIDITTGPIDIQQGETIGFYALVNNSFGGDFTVKAGSYISNTVLSAPYDIGDTLEIKNLLRDDPVIEYLEGIVHLWNLKSFTDEALKTVWFFPENGGDYLDSGEQEGYFFGKEDAKDMTDKIQVRSLEIKSESKDLKRQFRLAFKESTDGFISDLKLTSPLYAETVDFGESFESGIQLEENPYFEPSAMEFDKSIGIQAVTNLFRPYLMHLWDKPRNEDGTLPDQSTDIGPRIAMALPRDFITLSPSSIGETFPAFGSYLQEDPTGVSPGGVQVDQYNAFGHVFKFGIGTLLGGQIETSVVYNSASVNTLVKDQYGMFYQETVRSLYFAVPVDFLVFISHNDFVTFTHRQKWFVKYHHQALGLIQFFARVDSIRQYLLGKNLSTPVTLVPSVQNFNIDC